MRDGKPVLHPSGRPFKHDQEVREGQQGVKKVIEALKAQLGHPSLPAAERNRIHKEFSTASRLLEYTERFIPSLSMKELSNRYNLKELTLRKRPQDQNHPWLALHLPNSMNAARFAFISNIYFIPKWVKEVWVFRNSSLQ